MCGRDSPGVYVRAGNPVLAQQPVEWILALRLIEMIYEVLNGWGCECKCDSFYQVIVSLCQSDLWFLSMAVVLPPPPTSPNRWKMVNGVLLMMMVMGNTFAIYTHFTQYNNPHKIHI